MDVSFAPCSHGFIRDVSLLTIEFQNLVYGVIHIVGA